MNLSQMLKTPGMYVVVSYGGSFAVEVDALLHCHQCKPDAPFARDGVLSADGWYRGAHLDIFGPFARKEPNGKD